MKYYGLVAVAKVEYIEVEIETEDVPDGLELRKRLSLSRQRFQKAEDKAREQTNGKYDKYFAICLDDKGKCSKPRKVGIALYPKWI